MTWQAWIVIIYLVLDRFCHIALIGRRLEPNSTSAILALMTAAFIIWTLVDLAQ